MPHGQRRLSDRDHGILKLVESLHAHVALCAPDSADHMAQSGTDQHQRRIRYNKLRKKKSIEKKRTSVLILFAQLIVPYR